MTVTGLGFTFDKTTDNSPVTMKAISDKIRNKGSAPEDMFASYVPGRHNITNSMIKLTGNVFEPQEMKLVAGVPEEPGIKEVKFTLQYISRLPGFCENKSAPSGTGPGDDDFSFSPTANKTLVTVAVTNGYAETDFYCKDYGGYCTVKAEFITTNNAVFSIIVKEIPLDTNENGIADAWEQYWVDKNYIENPNHYVEWTPQLFQDPNWDDEPAMLGWQHYYYGLTHASGGDGLTVRQEYRGYWVDGGKDFTNAQHVALSPFRKELLVQVAAEDDYLSGLGTGDATNSDAVQAFNVNAVMQDVAKFYGDMSNGMGIDLYWVRTPFTMPTESHTYANGEVVANLYKHTGTNYYTASDAFADGEQAVINSTIWVYRDDRLKKENPEKFRNVFGAVNVGAGLFIQKNRNDTELREFVKIVLPSRVGTRERDAPYRYVMDPRSHAENNITSSILEARGAYVDVVNVSEEKYLETITHIPASDFVDLIKYCIAHELYHLIGGTHLYVIGFISGGFYPLDNMMVDSSELLLINLPARFSILP